MSVVTEKPVITLTESAAEESFSSHLLEYPHYTRPADYRGWKVPEVLIGGNHAEVAKWRQRMALEKTLRNRPDLYHQAEEPV